MRQPILTKQISYFSDFNPLEINAPDFIIKDIENKLSPFINIQDPTRYQSEVSIQSFQEEPEQNFIDKAAQGKDIVIDASLYKELSSAGKRYDINQDEYIISIKATGSLFLFNRKKKTIKIFNSNLEALSKDTLRLIKSLISLQCELSGAIMMHASCIVVGNNESVLFLGDSRNGKTTILLEALTKFEGTMLSCDTSLIEIRDNDVRVRGWPSNFSVSFGTMHDFKDLSGFLTSEKAALSYTNAWKIYDKHVLDTKKVIKTLNTEITPEASLKTLVFLNFDPGAETGISQLQARNKISAWIKKVYLGSLDELYPNWHKFWEISASKIEVNIESFVDLTIAKNIEVYEMNWAPAPESLLRKVNTLEPYHINMKARRNEI